MFGLEDGDVCNFGILIDWCGCEVDGLTYGEWWYVVGGAVDHYFSEDVFFGGCDGVY